MRVEQLVAGLCAALLAAAWAALRRGHPRWGRSFSAAAVALLVVSLGLRWAGTGHPPVFGTFEMDLAGTVALVALALPLGDGASRGAAAVGAITLLHALLLDPQPTPLTISEQSLWIDLHAVLAWAAWAGYWLALVEAWGPARQDHRALRLLGFAFLAHTGLGFTGVYYASLLFARPWEWDPVQTLGVLGWVLAAMALHFRLIHHVPLGRQRAFLAVVVAVYVLTAKAPMLLAPGQSFHVFELGRMAGPR